eukprot:CAMPEP_0174373840 /NCGR_PEP_ID=MMETSP0811_2-20130205/108718_1 /TAXON_ID=73025 ORGANISM="Eutreptiella gymnastica-like, Strain CCMP1594" /NCGR_SAMPLE_ID=MMETSP0811_2 /ASSEMBLY_ACC=CAM_ASM_000667 /LENGTH=37 /DNA_ID= /DNA_START= /DNA_END= /DNA_ORIENTATION=
MAETTWCAALGMAPELQRSHWHKDSATSESMLATSAQ